MNFRGLLQNKTLLNIIVFLSISSGLYSCQSDSNNIDSIRLECGESPIEADDAYRIIKILSLDDQALDSSGIKSLAITDSGVPLEVEVSPRGCVYFSEKFESLRIRAVSGAKNYAAVINKNQLSQPFTRIKVNPVPEISAEFVCPKEGLYAKDFIDIPLDFSSKENLSALGYKVFARSLSSNYLGVLAEKKIGSEFEKFGKYVSLTSIPVGDYQLELAKSSVGLGLVENYSFIPNAKTCVLHKIDAIPNLGVDSQKKYIAVNDLIAKADQRFVYKYCKIPLRDVLSSNKCELEGPCQNLDRFQTVSEIRAGDSGTFRYFYFQEDRLNDKSNVVCQDVSVSAQAPEVQIAWTNPDYSKPGASLDKPFVNLSLKIDVKHPDREKSDLESNLMCSGKFIIRNGLEIPAKVVRCESAECKGRDLSKPVPCGADLKINMKNVYDSKELWDSIFKVTVVSDDGNGKKSQDVAGIWMHSSRWEIDNLSERLHLEIKEEVRFRGNSFFKKDSDLYFGSALSRKKDEDKVGLVAQFHGKKETVFYSPNEEFTKPMIQPARSGVPLMVLWDSPRSDKCRLFKYGSSPEESEELVAPEKCQKFGIFTSGFGYFWGLMEVDSNPNGSERIISYIPFRFDGKEWIYLDKLADSFLECSSVLKFQIRSETDLNILCESLGLNVDYRDLKLSTMNSELPKVVQIEEPSPYVNGVRCDDTGMYVQDDELYYPMSLLVKDIEHAMGEIQWDRRFCGFYGATSHSIVVNEPDSLYRISISSHGVWSRIHYPEDEFIIADNPIVDSHGSHPLFSTKNGDLLILDSFEYASIKKASDMPKDLHVDGFSMQTLDRSSIVISVGENVWHSNPKSEWASEIVNDQLVYLPKWTKQNSYKCSEEMTEGIRFDGTKQIVIMDIVRRRGFPCVRILRDLKDTGESVFQFQILSTDSKNWNHKYKLERKCDPFFVPTQFENSNIISLRCGEEFGVIDWVYVDLENESVLKDKPQNRLDSFEEWGLIMNGGGLWNTITEIFP